MSHFNVYSVVDVETTGFSPKQHHRIIEIAIVRVGTNGEIRQEYETLVNPDRDIGPSQIHGLYARDLRNAPDFRQIAGDVLSLLAESTFVAHNVRFDWSFVESELRRVGVTSLQIPRLCTMELAGHLDPPISSRKLTSVCRRLSIPLSAHHCAMSDARAAAQVLARFLAQDCASKSVSILCKQIQIQDVGGDWPNLPRMGKTFTREEAKCVQAECPKSALARLVEQLPSYKDQTPEVNCYLACLDEALSDRILTAEESVQLSELAADLGLLKEQVHVAHFRYLGDLVKLAASDGVIDSVELEELEADAEQLGFSRDELYNLVEITRPGSTLREVNSKSSPASNTSLEGKLVCFTGDFQCAVIGHSSGREAAAQLAESRGMIVKSGVVKKLDFLVAADIDSMSIKAKKAREYGIPILAERDYWELMGFQVDG